jgi:hypothetical protein
VSAPSSALWRCNAASARSWATGGWATGGMALALREGSMGTAMDLWGFARLCRECRGVATA